MGFFVSFLDHFGLESLDQLPGIEDLKSAGLLRKGQVLGGLAEQNDEGDENLSGDSLLDDDFLHGFTEEDA